MATYPIRQLADNGGTAQFVPVTAPEAVQFPDGSNLNTLIGSIATIESNPVAANHAVGEFLCINGQVYEVIDAITAGDSIALGENVQAANLGSQITALNNGLTPEIVKVTSDLIDGDITFIKSGKVVTVNFFNSTKAAVPAWGESKLCAIPNGMLPAFGNEWSHGTITIQDGITTILVAYVDEIYVENKTSQTIGGGSWISGRLTYICE